MNIKKNDMEDNEMMGREFASMEDAIDDIEADVLTMYLYRVSETLSEQEKYAELARKFRLPIEEIERIILENHHNKDY